MGTSGQPGDAEAIAASVLDPTAFGAIVDAHAETVMGYLARRVGPALAEDLAAETFLKAFKARHTYQAVHDTALPWLYRIATNLLRNHVRDEQRRLEVLGRLAAQDAFNSADEQVVDAIAAAAQLQQLASVFAGLPGDSRDVLVLVGVERFTYEQAATALSVPVGTIRSRLSRARADLRQALSDPSGAAAHRPRGDEQEKGAVRD